MYLYLMYKYIMSLLNVGNKFYYRKVLEWGKDKKVIGKFFTWCLEKGEKGGDKLKEKAGTKGTFWALLLFVGIPIPGTGAWTGTLAASFLNIGFKTSIIAVALGVLLAGIIMSVGSKIVSVLGWTGLSIIIGFIVGVAVVAFINKKRKSKKIINKFNTKKNIILKIKSTMIKKKKS